METSNAFYMLILPVLQCTAGIFAAFAMIHLVRVVSGWLYSAAIGPEPSRLDERSAYANSYRLGSARSDRPHAQHLGVYR